MATRPGRRSWRFFLRCLLARLDSLERGLHRVGRGRRGFGVTFRRSFLLQRLAFQAAAFLFLLLFQLQPAFAGFEADARPVRLQPAR
jgi:hypothetical protein